MVVGIHPLSFSKINDRYQNNDASQWIISRNGLDTTTVLSGYMAKISELPVWYHGQGMSPVLHSPNDTWLYLNSRSRWVTFELFQICEDFPSWPAKDIQEICSRAKPNILSPLCVCLMHPCLHVPVGTYCCDSRNGKVCGDAVHLKVVLIYAPLFSNHKAWSNTMPTKSALFASLYGYNLWQIFNSCNLPETSNLEDKLR